MTYKDKIQISGTTALLAGIFCVVIATLLLLNYWQFSTNDPVESKVIDALVSRLKQEPDNQELIAEIRSFDLMTRKAYFNSQWQIKTGAYMLLAGAFIVVVALTFYYTLKSKINEPDIEHENEIASRILAQKWIVVVAVIFFGLALTASVSSVNYLEKYNTETAASVMDEKQVEEEIETVDVMAGVEENEQVNEETAFEEITGTITDPVEEELNENLSAAEPMNVVAKADVKVLSVDLIKNNHNSFRGPLGQGIAYHKNIPVSWDGSTGTNILWKVPVPRHGFNSPVIWGDKIFITGADASNREVYCFSRTDGTLLWTADANDIPGTPSAPPRVTEDTGLAASSATSDGQHIFAIFATGDVIALDLSGKRIWARNLGVPDNHYGHSSSLIVWDNKLLIQYDTNKGGKLLALNTLTGESIWETVRSSKISWASPVLAQVDGKYQIILTAVPNVAGYDVQTGKELWSVECMMGEVGPSVAFDDGVVYAANEYAKMVAYDIKSGEILWENDMYLPEAASPLAHNGLVYIATSYGVLVCYDGKTGEQYWEHDIGKTIYSSPVTADGKLFMMDNDGVMRIYEPGKELKLIAENVLGEEAGTTPAFSDGHIFIRGNEHLYCIGK